MDRKYSLNLNNVSAKASDALIKLDATFVGTPDYMGLTYFWHYNYRHFLRDNRKYWLKIHTALLKAGLTVNGYSRKHDAIIGNILNVAIVFENDCYKDCKSDHEQTEICNMTEPKSEKNEQIKNAVLEKIKSKGLRTDNIEILIG